MSQLIVAQHLQKKKSKIKDIPFVRIHIYITHCLIFTRRDDTQAAAVLARSGLGKKDLGRLWTLADADRDGELSRHEFAVAMHLAACATTKEKGGLTLPRTLPSCLALGGKRSGGGGGKVGAAGVAAEGGTVMATTTTEREGADKGSVSTLESPQGLSEDGGLEEKAASSSSNSRGDRQFDRRGKKPQEDEGLELLSWEERDDLYAMSTLERAGYDVVFMQVCVILSPPVNGQL